LYVDANIFIFARFSLEKEGIAARAFLEKIKNGLFAVTSTLTIDEVMWVIKKNGKNHQLREIIEDIYDIQNLEIVELPVDVPLKAIDVIERFNLKPRDAFHVATMEHFRIKEIASEDADFDKIPWVKRKSL